MEETRGPWKKHESREIFRSDFFTVADDRVTKPDGKQGNYASVSLKRGIGVVALDRTNHVYLVEQFRYVPNRTSIEIICGGVEEGEDDRGAALRELSEEGGITRASLEDLGVIDIDSSIVHAEMRLWIAKVDEVGEAHPEGVEEMKVLRVPFDRAINMVLQSKITHAPSCVALLRAALVQRNSD